MKTNKFKKVSVPLDMRIRELIESEYFNESESLQILYMEYELKIENKLINILSLVKKILHEDTQFQNLNSEIEKAKEAAIRISEIFNSIKSLVSDIDLSDAPMLVEILKMLDFPFMRVLGDRIKNEEEIKNYYRSEIIKDLLKKHNEEKINKMYFKVKKRLMTLKNRNHG